jgi:hypothetical protein
MRDANFVALRLQHALVLERSEFQSGLRSSLIGTRVRKCNEATCRFITVAACVRRLPSVLLKSSVVTLCSQKVHLNLVPPFIDLVV